MYVSAYTCTYVHMYYRVGGLIRDDIMITYENTYVSALV